MQYLPNPEDRIAELRKTKQLKQAQIEEMSQEIKELKRTIQELIAEADRTSSLAGRSIQKPRNTV